MVTRFRTKYEPITYYDYSGEVFADEYGLVLHDDELVLEVVGKTNVQERIQSHKDSGNINLLIARFNAGDPNALNVVEGAFFDARELPSSYAEMYAKLRECEDIFNHLPSEVKDKFNNNHIEFWSSIDKPNFADRLGEIKSYADYLAEFRNKPASESEEVADE